MSAQDQLAAFIARVDALGRLNEDAAKAAESAVAAAARKTAAAGTTPTGEAWVPLRTGGKPLEGAAEAIKTEVSGASITLRIKTPFAYHQHGGSTGKFHSPKRKIIPDTGDDVPPQIRKAIQDSAAKIVGKAGG